MEIMILLIHCALTLQTILYFIRKRRLFNEQYVLNQTNSAVSSIVFTFCVHTSLIFENSYVLNSVYAIIIFIVFLFTTYGRLEGMLFVQTVTAGLFGTMLGMTIVDPALCGLPIQTSELQTTVVHLFVISIFSIITFLQIRK